MSVSIAVRFFAVVFIFFGICGFIRARSFLFAVFAVRFLVRVFSLFSIRGFIIGSSRFRRLWLSREGVWMWFWIEGVLEGGFLFFYFFCWYRMLRVLNKFFLIDGNGSYFCLGKVMGCFLFLRVCVRRKAISLI